MQERLALVLSGGGARAAYQVGVLRAIAERMPDLQIPIITGVSAGAINAVYLAAHAGPLQTAVTQLRGQWLRLTPDLVYQVRPLSVVGGLVRTAWQSITGTRTGPAAVRGLMEVGPLRKFLEGSVHLDGIGRNIAAGRLRAVALSTTSYATGETVTWVQGAPDVEMWQRHLRRAVRSELTLDHVLASSAIPIIFPAVRIGDAFYGDGSVRMTAPLAPAIHLGASRVMAVAMRAQSERHPPPEEPVGDYPAAVQVMGLLLHSIFLDSLDADAERLERLNHLIARIDPAKRPPDLRTVDLSVIRPSKDLGAMAGGVPVRLPRLVDLLLRTIGGRRVQASDFLSYLLFEPEYTGEVMDLGYADAQAQWGEIERFLTGGQERPEAASGGPGVASTRP
jgi:NTE family protein